MRQGVKLIDFGASRRLSGSETRLDATRHAADRAAGGELDPLAPAPNPSGESVGFGETIGETGTYRWMAPEVVRHEAYASSAEVFSYSMVLYELITHSVPFDDRPPLQAAISMGFQALRPPLPPHTPSPVRRLVEQCWAEQPKARPTFERVSSDLAEMATGLSVDELEWLDCPTGHPADEPSTGSAWCTDRLPTVDCGREHPPGSVLALAQ